MADLRNVDELPIEIRNQVNSVLASKDALDDLVEVKTDVLALVESKDDIDALIAAGPVDADTAQLDVAQAWSKRQFTTPVELTWGVTIPVDASLSNVFTVTLTGATARLDNPTNLVAGQSFMVIVTQDGTGGRAMTFDTKYSFGANGTPDMTQSVLNIVDIIACYVVTTNKIACTVIRGF